MNCDLIEITVCHTVLRIGVFSAMIVAGILRLAPGLGGAPGCWNECYGQVMRGDVRNLVGMLMNRTRKQLSIHARDAPLVT